jgi:hypothetical protein
VTGGRISKRFLEEEIQRNCMKKALFSAEVMMSEFILDVGARKDT